MANFRFQDGHTDFPMLAVNDSAGLGTDLNGSFCSSGTPVKVAC
jgi:hypothetical protein